MIDSQWKDSRSWDEKYSHFCGLILLACLQHPGLKKKAMQAICDTGNIWLHLLATTISVDKRLFRWSKIVNQIEQQCAARNRIEIMLMNES